MTVMRLNADEIDVLLTALDAYDPAKDDLATPEVKVIYDRLASLLLEDAEIAIPEILIILNDEDTAQATETTANEAAVIAPITEADIPDDDQRLCTDCNEPLPDDATSDQCDDCFEAENEADDDEDEDEEDEAEVPAGTVIEA